MKRGDKLFVRIDYKNDTDKFTDKDFDDHIEYLEGIASKRYFIGGGFSNKPGGIIIFAADNIEEAKEIVDNDPIIKREFYTYELFEWDLVIISDNAFNNK